MMIDSCSLIVQTWVDPSFLAKHIRQQQPELFIIIRIETFMAGEH